jgi:hypothetical protein
MNKDAEKRIAAQLAKAMTMMCVRNTLLEDLHAGPGPVTRTGDYSDGLCCTKRPVTEVPLPPDGFILR